MTRLISDVAVYGCFLSLSIAGASAELAPRTENPAGAPGASIPAHGDGCGVAAALSAGPSFLENCRPEAITPKVKQAVLEMLPTEGEVTDFNKADLEKLEAIAEVLRVYGRENVYEVKIIDVPQAWAGLLGRAVVLISKTALRLLDVGQLQALVAHEVAHEYHWAEYEAAHATTHAERLHELEFACDGIGVRGLQKLGVDPMQLIRALEAVQTYNLQRFGAAIDTSSHPSLKERKRHIKQIVAASSERFCGRASRRDATSLEGVEIVQVGAAVLHRGEDQSLLIGRDVE